VVAQPLPVPVAQQADPLAVRNAARILREKKNVLILLGGTALREGAQALAWRASQATGAKLLAEGSNGRVQRGQGRLPLERVPYPADVAIKALEWVEHIILVNSRGPVGFFAYPGKPSLHYPATAEVHVLTRYEQDAEAALRALCDELGAAPVPMPDVGKRPEAARGAPTPEGLARTVAALMPEEAIIADESVSFGRGFYSETFAAPKHDWLHITGGAIGLWPAAGDRGGDRRVRRARRVIDLHGRRRSAMYTVQALWTQARERLPVTTVILSNRKYQILLGEYQNVGGEPRADGDEHAGPRQSGHRLGEDGRGDGRGGGAGNHAGPGGGSDGAVLRSAGAVPDRARYLTSSAGAVIRRLGLRAPHCCAGRGRQSGRGRGALPDRAGRDALR
jgi:acetolactate synthase-1/2/3 large subunit